jgi:hypothetical protein
VAVSSTSPHFHLRPFISRYDTIADEYRISRHMANLKSARAHEGTHDIHILTIGEHITGIAAFYRGTCSLMPFFGRKPTWVRRYDMALTIRLTCALRSKFFPSGLAISNSTKGV